MNSPDLSAQKGGDQSVELTQYPDSSLPPAYDDWWYTPISGGQTSAGDRVNAISAQRVATVYACCHVLSKTVSTQPIDIIKQAKGETKEQLYGHWLGKLLKKPNPLMNRVRFFRLVTWDLLLRGNFYALKVKDSVGRTVQLIPLNPDLIEIIPDEEDYAISYRYQMRNKFINIPHEDIFHVIENSQDGIKGRSAIEAAADVVAAGLSLQNHHNAILENDAKPAGVISIDGVYKDNEQRKRERQEWEAIHKGSRQSGKVAFMELGAKYSPIAMTSRDAQLVELMQFSNQQICAIFDVPPYRVQDFIYATFSNVTETSINWGKNSIQPINVTIEEHLAEQIVEPFEDSDVIKAKFNMDSILRASTKERYEANKIGIEAGFITKNEVRISEDLPPIDGLDEEKATKAQEESLNQRLNKLIDEQNELKKKLEQVTLSKSRIIEVIQENTDRLSTKEENAIKRALKKEDALSICNDFYSKHKSLLFDSLKSPYCLYKESVSNDSYNKDNTLLELDCKINEYVNRQLRLIEEDSYNKEEAREFLSELLV